jgi:hypothetical protein
MPTHFQNLNLCDLTRKTDVVIRLYHEVFGKTRTYFLNRNRLQHLLSGGGAEVLPVPSGDGFEAENSINFLGQSILFHN